MVSWIFRCLACGCRWQSADFTCPCPACGSQDILPEDEINPP